MDGPKWKAIQTGTACWKVYHVGPSGKPTEWPIADFTSEEAATPLLLALASEYKFGKEASPFCMTLNEYQEGAARTGNGVSSTKEGLSLVGLGITGEAGEVADLIKKHLHHGHELDAGKLIKEAGDVLWYISLLATVLGVTMEDIGEANLAKLRKRYPNGFSHEASINREPELERGKCSHPPCKAKATEGSQCGPCALWTRDVYRQTNKGPCPKCINHDLSGG
jgi:NTP pyrophosphatase (non-canonical NTP hydrolase)